MCIIRLYDKLSINQIYKDSMIITYNEIFHAKQAIEEYDADIRAGGEPFYPKWAFDLLKQYEKKELKND
jgi:hypothetical protein